MIDFSKVEEYCPFCQAVTEIPFDKVSKCSECGRELFPCAGCDVPALCDWSGETFSCHRFAHSIEEIELIKAKRNARNDSI